MSCSSCCTLEDASLPSCAISVTPIARQHTATNATVIFRFISVPLFFGVPKLKLKVSNSLCFCLHKISSRILCGGEHSGTRPSSIARGGLILFLEFDHDYFKRFVAHILRQVFPGIRPHGVVGLQGSIL